MAANFVVKAPEDLSKISAGSLLADGTLITGHENGYVAKWNSGVTIPEIILRASSTVHSVEQGESGDVYVGCNAGDLYRLKSPQFQDHERILAPTNTKQTRVFRTYEIRPGEVLYTSTYGVVNVLRREKSGWRANPLTGHSNAVFAVAKSKDGVLATGDYSGAIRLWRAQGPDFVVAGQLRIPSYVSGLRFLGVGLLAAVGKSGTLYLFERQSDGRLWRAVFESASASAQGKAVAVSPDQTRVIAATEREIIEIDPASQVMRSASVNGAIAVFPRPDGVFVLTDAGLAQLPWSELKINSDVIEYEYLKVSLLGNTGYGKTTLSSALATGDPGDHQSTFGRRVWTWKPHSSGTPHRVLLNDNGGQEQVIGTLLPLSADSDIVLFFFKRTELSGLNTAIELHDRLRPNLNPAAKSYLVETYIDQTLIAVTDKQVQRAIKESGFDGVLQVAANSASSVESFKVDFIGKLDWSVARKAVQSKAMAGLIEILEALKSEGRTVLNFNDLRRAFEERTKTSIYVYHLKFLLQGLTDSGLVEYYPSIGDKVVIDDPEFNRLRTEIPVLAREDAGLVLWKRVTDAFPGKELYVAMLDKYYTANGIALDIRDNEWRLFPAFLEDKPLRLPDNIAALLQGSSDLLAKTFPTRENRITNLLEALFDLKLDVVGLTANEGLFAWGTNAYLYYRLSTSQGALEGPRLIVRYKTAGPNAATAQRLLADFEQLLVALYGNPIDPAGG